LTCLGNQLNYQRPKTYMGPYHDMRDLGVINSNGQHEIARFADALAHKEASVLSFLQQQFLCVFAHHVSMKPPSDTKKPGNLFPFQYV